MKWLQNNLPGAILLAACGLLLLVGTLLALSWSRPITSDAAAGSVETPGADENANRLADLGPLGEYRVVTDRPVFNETRRPVIEVEEEVAEPKAGEPEVAVADAPSLNLTGVVITPEARLVSLTPTGGGEPLLFREGRPMHGEYNGWVISEVRPRQVVLESTAGDTLELDLVVFKQKIKEPPPPVKPAAAKEQDEDPSTDELEEERLSRAEEIRQRIAERREQLRREAAEKQQAGGGQKPRSYQDAIRSLMNSQSSEKNADADEDG